MALLRSVRKPPFSRTMVPPSLLCSHLTPPASGVLHSAAPRAVHSCPLFLSGKGNSRPHYWVSTVSLANSLESPLPRGRLHQPLLLLGLSCPCPAQAHSAAGWLPGLRLWPHGGFLVTPGAWLEPTEPGTRVPMSLCQEYTGALVLPPPHPALLRLEPGLEPNRAPTLSFLGHVPIGCPWGNRVTRDVC